MKINFNFLNPDSQSIVLTMMHNIASSCFIYTPEQIREEFEFPLNEKNAPSHIRGTTIGLVFLEGNIIDLSGYETNHGRAKHINLFQELCEFQDIKSAIIENDFQQWEFDNNSRNLTFTMKDMEDALFDSDNSSDEDDVVIPNVTGHTAHPSDVE